MFSFLKAAAPVCFILCLAMTAQAQPQKQVADKIIAFVGDQIILRSDIKNSLDDLQRQGDKLPANIGCLVTEQVLISKLLMLQANKDSLQISDEEVEAELEQRIRYIIKDISTRKDAGEIDQLKQGWRKAIKERRLVEAMQEKLLQNVKITPSEVKVFFEKIPVDSLPFYEPLLEIGEIVIYPKASAEMEKHTLDEMNLYRKQLEKKMISFSRLAASVSEDMESRETGGLCEWNRNDKAIDPTLLSTAMLLKEGEISTPVKSKSGYHILQVVERNGDDIVVNQILRIPPVTALEFEKAEYKLAAIRSEIVAGIVDFDKAAKETSQSKYASFSVYLPGSDGLPSVTMEQLNDEMAALIREMNVGDISKPLYFLDEYGKKGVRLIYLRSRSRPHRMNLADDYSKIAQMALEEKKASTLSRWIKAKIPDYHIMVEEEVVAECPELRKFASLEGK